MVGADFYEVPQEGCDGLRPEPLFVYPLYLTRIRPAVHCVWEFGDNGETARVSAVVGDSHKVPDVPCPIDGR